MERYIEELFVDERGEIPQMHYIEGPVILKEEVRKAIIPYDLAKAPGDDEMSTKLLQVLDKIGLDKIT